MDDDWDDDDDELDDEDSEDEEDADGKNEEGRDEDKVEGDEDEIEKDENENEHDDGEDSAKMPLIYLCICARDMSSDLRRKRLLPSDACTLSLDESSDLPCQSISLPVLFFVTF